jgi:hypothetical protein
VTKLTIRARLALTTTSSFERTVSTNRWTNGGKKHWKCRDWMPERQA